MNDEQIYQKGGTDGDVERYAKLNGADLTQPKENKEKELREEFYKDWPVFQGKARKKLADWWIEKVEEARKEGYREGLEDGESLGVSALDVI